VAKIEIRNRHHFQSTACCNVLEIPAVRGDEQLGSEKARSFTAKAPGDVGLFRFDLLQANSVRQKNCEPRLRSHWFWMSFVNLDLHIAGLHVHIIKSPLPYKRAPGIEFGSDTVGNE
jgi:hypothetical protein